MMPDEKALEFNHGHDFDFTGLNALYINCTLKRSPQVSHTYGLAEKSIAIMIERLYGNSHLLNDSGQYTFYGRVGGCLVTGNEDGVKHCAMNILYSLQHLGLPSLRRPTQDGSEQRALAPPTSMRDREVPTTTSPTAIRRS